MTENSRNNKFVAIKVALFRMNVGLILGWLYIPSYMEYIPKYWLVNLYLMEYVDLGEVGIIFHFRRKSGHLEERFPTKVTTF